MKKSILILAVAFTFSAFFTSCREEKKENTKIEVRYDTDDTGNDIEDAAEDVGDAIKGAADDVGDAVKKGVDDVKDKTRTKRTDDL